jgi:hypothetical protein
MHRTNKSTTSIDPILHKMDDFANLPIGWDSYRAPPPNEKALEMATDAAKIIGNLRIDCCGTLNASPLLYGGVMLSLSELPLLKGKGFHDRI